MQTGSEPIGSRLSTQTIRFLLIGGLAGLVDLSIFTILTHLLGFHPLNANLVSRPIGGMVSFLGHKHWTFEKGRPAGTQKQALRYTALWLTLFFFSEALVGLFHTLLKLPPVPSKLAAEVTLGLFSFLYHKFFTFR